MPLHEYRCLACGQTTEVLQRMDDPPMQICSQCGGQLQKLMSAPALHFKGSGFYITDYPRGGAKPAGSREKETSGGDSPGSSKEKPAGDGASPSPGETPKSEGAKTETAKNSDSKPSGSKPES